MSDLTDLHGCRVLIVESGTTRFGAQLQEVIEREGAESLVARDLSTALECCSQFSFDAALINVENRAIADRLGLPFLLYAIGRSTVEGIVGRLGRLLAA